LSWNSPAEGDINRAVTRGGSNPMATIQPKGERVRQAVKWISAELLEDPKKRVQKLIQEAAQRFNLSPVEEESLVSFYREKKG
jgi:hypothetical protein